MVSKVDPALLQKLYSIPPFDDICDFLIKVALTRGRLGKVSLPITARCARQVTVTGRHTRPRRLGCIRTSRLEHWEDPLLHQST